MDSPPPENRWPAGAVTGDLAAALARWGPTGTTPPPTLREAQAYCRAHCRRHYENFTVASWLLPRSLRAHFAHVYAYCRWADDLADECSDPSTALELLDWWEAQLDACYAGRVRHPVFVALRETIAQFQIPKQPWQDLLTAFRRDQRQSRYESWDELLDYCRGSANPVGRIVLALGRCDDPENVELSDQVCTGLQIANFCQDVARDYDRGRIYLPRESWRVAGYSESDFARRVFNAPFQALVRDGVDRAERLLAAGDKLVPRVAPPLRFDVALFVAGGRDLLRAIRRQRYDVWAHRPTVGHGRKVWLAVRSLGARWRS